MPTLFVINSSIYRVNNAEALTPYGLSPMVHAVFNTRERLGYIPGARMILLELVDELVKGSDLTVMLRDYSRRGTQAGHLDVTQKFIEVEHPFDVSTYYRSGNTIQWGVYPTLESMRTRHGFIPIGVLWTASHEILPRLVPPSLMGSYQQLIDDSYR